MLTKKNLEERLTALAKLAEGMADGLTGSGEDLRPGVLADAYCQVEKLDTSLGKLGKKLGLDGDE